MKSGWIEKVFAKTAKAVLREDTRQSNATFKVLNSQIFGFSVAKVKEILNREFDIKCILHSEGNYLEAVSDSTQLAENDLIVVSAFEHDFSAIEALIGRLQRKQG